MTNMIAKSIYSIISKSLDNALVMGHDPMQGHYPCDTSQGKSCFYTYDPFRIIKAGLKRGRPFDVEFEYKTCIIKVYLDTIIGHATTCPPVEGNSYTIKQVHGSLQAVGIGAPTKKDVDVITLIITEEGPDKWVLATIFPGLPEPQPDVSGLEEGDSLTTEQLTERGFTRIVCE